MPLHTYILAVSQTEAEGKRPSSSSLSSLSSFLGRGMLNTDQPFFYIGKQWTSGIWVAAWYLYMMGTPDSIRTCWGDFGDPFKAFVYISPIQLKKNQTYFSFLYSSNLSIVLQSNISTKSSRVKTKHGFSILANIFLCSNGSRVKTEQDISAWVSG